MLVIFSFRNVSYRYYQNKASNPGSKNWRKNCCEEISWSVSCIVSYFYWRRCAKLVQRVSFFFFYIVGNFVFIKSHTHYSLNVAVLRQASYGTLKIGVYQSLKSLACPENTFMSNIMCGVTAGVISAALANPTDVLKVRLQAKNQHFQHTAKISGAFVSIYRNEGIRGLWRVSFCWKVKPCCVHVKAKAPFHLIDPSLCCHASP